MSADANTSVGRTIPLNAFEGRTDLVAAARELGDKLDAQARELEDKHIRMARAREGAASAGADMNLNIMKAR